MENDIAFITSGFLVFRIVVIGLFAYAIYRVLKNPPKRVPVRSQSRFARERLAANRTRY